VLRPVGGLLPVLRRAPEPVRRNEFAADPERARWWRERLDRVAALVGAPTS
jgi:O-succinylbenzoate synthase